MLPMHHHTLHGILYILIALGCISYFEAGAVSHRLSHRPHWLAPFLTCAWDQTHTDTVKTPTPTHASVPPVIIKSGCPQSKPTFPWRSWWGSHYLAHWPCYSSMCGHTQSTRKWTLLYWQNQDLITSRLRERNSCVAAPRSRRKKRYI